VFVSRVLLVVAFESVVVGESVVIEEPSGFVAERALSDGLTALVTGDLEVFGVPRFPGFVFFPGSAAGAAVVGGACGVSLAVPGWFGGWGGGRHHS
jgi:hypothetical protein